MDDAISDFIDFAIKDDPKNERLVVLYEAYALQLAHKYLDMISNLEFRQWCDTQPQDAVKMRKTFMLVCQEKKSVELAAATFCVTVPCIHWRIRNYKKLVDRYVSTL